MRALVTGGAGFIGSHLVGALLERGDEVVVLDDLSTGRRANLAEASSHPPARDRVRFVEADGADPAAVEAAARGADVVFHQAAIPSVPRSLEEPVVTLRANVVATAAVLEAARRAGTRRVVLASSSSVYGETPGLPKDEAMPAVPISPYGVSKWAAERLAVQLGAAHGVETVALRYFNVFGPRQDPRSEYAAVIPRFVAAALRDRPPVVHGDGGQTRDFTYVENVVEANLLAAASPAGRVAGRVFNVAAGRETSLLDLLDLIGRIVGREVRPTHGPPRAGDIRRSVASVEAARAAFGYAPRVDLEEGLRRTIEWYRARPEELP
jgi:UDP-glucose 4-epimerase